VCTCACKINHQRIVLQRGHCQIAKICCTCAHMLVMIDQHNLLCMPEPGGCAHIEFGLSCLQVWGCTGAGTGQNIQAKLGEGQFVKRRYYEPCMMHHRAYARCLLQLLIMIMSCFHILEAVILFAVRHMHDICAQVQMTTVCVTGPPKDDVYPLGFPYMNGCCTAVTSLPAQRRIGHRAMRLG
jgi:hypothetical protein